MQKFDYMKNALRSDLKPRARLVLQCLILHCNNHSECFPSIKTIAAECNYGVSTVKRALNDLCEAGYLRKQVRFDERKKGGQTSNLYTLLVVSEPSEEKEEKILGSQTEEKKPEKDILSVPDKSAKNKRNKPNPTVKIRRTHDMNSIYRWTGEQSTAEPP